MRKLLLGCELRSIMTRDSGALCYERQNRVNRRRWYLRETPHFLNHGDKRIDLHRASALKILQHGLLVRAVFARSFDPPLDIDAKFHAKCLRDALALQHHGLRQGARCRISADLVQRRMRQRADRIETDIAPQLEPDFVADPIEDGRLQSGLDEQRGEPFDIRAFFSGGFSERKVVALALADAAGRLDLRRGINYASDCAFRAQLAPLPSARIDALKR